MYTVKPGRACGKDEGGVRDAREPKLMLLPAITDGNEPGEPDARKPARPVRERVVRNVSTSRVRERRVSFQSLSPALLETRQRARRLDRNMLYADGGVQVGTRRVSKWAK